jgi:hypothetical protein
MTKPMTQQMTRTMKLLLLALVAATLAVLAACSRPGSGDTPLPTKERTVGRVQEGLQKADDEAAKRRAEIDRVGEPDESKPGKSISSGY